MDYEKQQETVSDGLPKSSAEIIAERFKQFEALRRIEAASPELLEACTMALDWFNAVPGYKESAEVADKLAAAILKACEERP